MLPYCGPSTALNPSRTLVREFKAASIIESERLNLKPEGYTALFPLTCHPPSIRASAIHAGPHNS